jgi:hypothetical protein
MSMLLLGVYLGTFLDARPPQTKADGRTCRGPLVAPKEWTYIPLRTVDSWTGAYHDATSGAFVSFDVVWAGSEQALATFGTPASSVVKRGHIEGVAYEMYRTTDVPLDRLQVGCRGSSEGLNSRSADSATVLKVQFLTDDRLWTFAGSAVSGAQEKRISELLVERTLRLCRGRLESVESERDDVPVTATANEALHDGTSVEEVMAAFGRPVSAMFLPPRGFILWYMLETPNGTVGTVKFCFDGHSLRGREAVPSFN